MKQIDTAAAMRAYADEQRCAGRRLALVPTMGALHAGHLALVEEARRHADRVIVSVFVNPTQFGPGEDFERYPRRLDEDRRALEAAGGVDVLFAPGVAELYPDGQEHQRVWVDLEGLDAHLCGASRPGHFRGVVTVVTKLFHLCKPHAACFGLKDAQQFLILRRMARDLSFEVALIGVSTVREADGLALSSRNVYLRPEERAQATVLSKAVQAAHARIAGGEQRAEAVVSDMLRVLGQAPDGRVQYAEVVDTGTLQPVDRIAPGQEVLAAVAVFFGSTRLIDNAFARAPGA